MTRRIIFLVALLMLSLPAATALAGGWVVLTLESLPGQIPAGQPTSLTFMVRRHGRTPIDNVSPVLLATHSETGRQVRVNAEPAGETGLFVANFSLPEAGTWEWSIQVPSFNHTATFAPLTVLPGGEPARSPQTSPAAFQWQILTRWFGLALMAAAAALFAIDRWRGREAIASASGD
jgi:hypothetical protein